MVTAATESKITNKSMCPRKSSPLRADPRRLIHKRVMRIAYTKRSRMYVRVCVCTCISTSEGL